MARTLPSAVLCALVLMSSSPDPPQPGEPLARGDAAWERRSGPGGEPVAAAAAEAVAAYAAAVEARPEALEPRWKLLRALHFQGDFLAAGEDERRQIFTRARDLAEETLDRVAEGVGGRQRLEEMEPAERAAALAGQPEMAAVFFWSAVAWGQWGDTVGKLKAARQGVAGRLRDLAGTALALDETLDGAAPHRFLGRLHTVAPKIPFVTGWVDRGLALEHLRRAVELAPEEPENQLFLAEAILEHHRELRHEALEILRRLAGREPRPDQLAQDRRILEQARQRLAEEERR